MEGFNQSVRERLMPRYHSAKEFNIRRFCQDTVAKIQLKGVVGGRYGDLSNK